MPDHFYVYPEYLGRGLSREEGRRVPESAALTELTAIQIVEAAKRLGYKAELEEAKHYPRRAFEFAGRVKVTKKADVSKGRFLRLLAAELAKHRPPASPHK